MLATAPSSRLQARLDSVTCHIVQDSSMAECSVTNHNVLGCYIAFKHESVQWLTVPVSAPGQPTRPPPPPPRHPPDALTPRYIGLDQREAQIIRELLFDHT